jgi:hypothetical protein
MIDRLSKLIIFCTWEKVEGMQANFLNFIKGVKV